VPTPPVPPGAESVPLCFRDAAPRSEKPTRRGQGSGPRRLPDTGVRARPCLLIVEDDEDMRELYRWCMRAAGWVVETATDGAEALLVAPVLEPDVIVMDLRLPVLGGLEAARWLKADPETRHIPIVALSGVDPRQGEPLATEAGCEVFVAKPCSPEQLRAVLENLVTGRDSTP
jgi:two-component system cell cycle response regulator DivK